MIADSARLTRVSTRTKSLLGLGGGGVGLGSVITLIVMVQGLQEKQEQTLREVQSLKLSMAQHSYDEQVARSKAIDDRADQDRDKTLAAVDSLRVAVTTCLRSRRDCPLLRGS